MQGEKDPVQMTSLKLLCFLFPIFFPATATATGHISANATATARVYGNGTATATTTVTAKSSPDQQSPSPVSPPPNPNSTVITAPQAAPKATATRTATATNTVTAKSSRDQKSPSPVSPPPNSLPPPPPPAPPGKRQNTLLIVIIVVPTFIVTFIVIFMFICLRMRKARKKAKTICCSNEDSNEVPLMDSLRFDFGTIKTATDNFSSTNKRGQGGFGAVYKGNLSDGQEIAVKRLSKNSAQGEREFKNEVSILARLQHRNLVRFFGYCIQREERLLMYEFLPNGSLNNFIFNPDRANLDWKARYKIIIGIARGLLYLHEDSRLRVVHLDLKASNILIDNEMNAKISDFGLARLFLLDQSQEASTVGGTFGYMAPEYVARKHFSTKSDVFSFGVLVLEIVSGQERRSFSTGEVTEEDLVSYAWKSWRNGTPLNLVDPPLREGPTNEIIRCIHIGLLCVQEMVADRPTMGFIVSMLNSNSTTLEIPSEPYMTNSRAKPESKVEVSISELEPR